MVMNLYLKCVLCMTVCQMTYDISIFPILHACSSRSGNKLCTAVFSAGYSFGGAGAAVWSMYLIILAIFTIEMGRQPSAKEQFYTALVTNLVLGAFAIPFFKAGYGASSDLKAFGDLLVIYNHVRLSLIAMSFGAVCRMGWLLRKVTAIGKRSTSPLYHLLRKLVLYPVVQCVTRLGTTPYDLWYHATFAAYPENGTGLQTFLAYLEVLLAPAAGIGAFLVFLVMQTGARTQLWRMLRLDFAITEAVDTNSTKNPQHLHTTDKRKRDSRSSAKGSFSAKPSSGDGSTKVSPPDSNNSSSNAKSELSTMEEHGNGEEGRGNVYGENAKNGDAAARFDDVHAIPASVNIDDDYAYEEEDDEGSEKKDWGNDAGNSMDSNHQWRTLQDMTESELIEKYISDTHDKSNLPAMHGPGEGISPAKSEDLLQPL